MMMERAANFVGEALRWHVLITEQGREKTAAAGFVGRGWRVDLPVIVKQEFVNGKVSLVKKGNARCRHTRDVIKPMFPGYMLIELPPMHTDSGAQIWHRIKSVVGVRDFLRFDGRACVVSQRLVDAMRSVQEAEQAKSIKIAKGRWLTHPFKIGQDVRVKKGAFESFFAKVTGLDDRGRAKAALHIFGRETEVELDYDFLEAL